MLKSRAQGIRDGARAALTAAAADLGPSYLVYIAELLRGLLTQGFQGHVLGYTLHAILAAQARAVQGSPSAVQVVCGGRPIKGSFSSSSRAHDWCD